EARAVAARLGQAHSRSLGLFKAHFGKLSGRDTVVVESGLGANAAYAATLQVIEFYPLRFVFDFGLAGAVSPDLKIGDLLLPEKIVPYDLPSSFSYLATIEGALTDEQKKACSREAFEARAIRIAGLEPLAEAVGARRVVLGCADIGISSARDRRFLHREFGFDAVDWETCAVIEAARSRGVAAVSLRVVSDLANEQAEQQVRESYRRVLAHAADTLVRHLWDFLKLAGETHEPARR
ncbi:MAG: 5'-methylthioadenosine/S-adenosylhomocysteine nucleosidase, partial [bacterium]